MALENTFEKFNEQQQLDLQTIDNPLDALSQFNAELFASPNEELDEQNNSQLTTEQTTKPPILPKFNFGEPEMSAETRESIRKLSQEATESEIRARQKQRFQQFKTDVPKIIEQSIEPLSVGRGYVFDEYSTNVQRYAAYGKETFNKLGFNPFLENEEYYNSNTTKLQDWSRMWSQYGKLFSPAFFANYRSTGNFFKGGKYQYDILAPDLKGAGQFEDALNIGMSSKKGILPSLSNFSLQTAYTAGIAINTVVEEIALWAASAALSEFTGGGSLAGAAELTAANLSTKAALLKNFRRAYESMKRGMAATHYAGGATMFRGGFEMMKSFKDIARAREFYTGLKAGAKTFGKGAVHFFNPIRGTTKLISEARSGVIGWNNMSNLARLSTGMGAFYRDVRENLYAISESQMEGGSDYNRVLEENMRIYQETHDGAMPVGKDLKDIYERAEAAGHWGTLTNIPLIYVSNRFVFDGLFNFKGISNTVTEELAKAGGKGAAKNIKFDLLSRSFKENVESFLQRSKAGLRSLPSTFLNYTKANFAEGIQENLQEVSSSAITNYYVNTYKDPSLGGSDYLKSQIYAGIDENIFSKQGLEIFLNGFAMGAPMRGISKTATWSLEKVSNLYLKRKLGKEGYKEYVANKAKAQQEALTQLNEIIADPEKYFSRKKENIVNQKNGNFQMDQAQIDGNDRLYYNAKDGKTLDQIFTTLDSGTFPLLMGALNDMKGLTDDELANAFNIEDGTLAREKLEGYLETAVNLKSRYDFFNERFSNPFNPKKFVKAKKSKDFKQSQSYLTGKLGAKEFLQSIKEEVSGVEEDDAAKATLIANKIINESPEQEAYVKEVIAYKAFEDAKKTAIAAEYSFGRAVDRMEKVFDDIVKDKLVSKASSADFVILQSVDNINKEMQLLRSEIDSFDKETATKEQKQLIKKKQEKLQALGEYKTHLNNFLKNKTEDVVDENGKLIMGDNDELLAPLNESFKNYLKVIANIYNDNYVFDGKVDDTFKKMVDYYNLDGDAQRFLGVLNKLLIPENMYRFADTINTNLTNLFGQAEALAKTSIGDYFKINEFKILLNQLATIGVTISPEDIQDILIDNIIPRTFYDLKNNSVIDSSDPRYSLIIDLISKFVNIQKQEKGEEIIEPEEVITERQKEAEPTPTTPEIKIVPAVVEAPKKEAYSDELENLLKEAYNEYITNNPGSSETFEDYVRDSARAARIKEEYQTKQQETAKKSSTSETAATFTPTEPYGTPKGPEVTTAVTPTAPVSKQEHLIISSDVKTALKNGRKKQVVETDENGNQIVKEVDFTKDDAEVELDRLQTLAERGKLTLEEFQKSFFAQVTDSITFKAAAERIKTDAKGFISDLRKAFEGVGTPEASVSDIEAKKADIERRRKISLQGIEEGAKIGSEEATYYGPNWDPLDMTSIVDNITTVYGKTKQELIDRINAKYDTELATLESGKSTETTGKQTAPTINVEAEKKKLEEERDKKIQEEAPIKTLDYPLQMVIQGGNVEPEDIKKVSEILKEDQKKYLKVLEQIALRLAQAGIQPIYYGRQTVEAIKNVLALKDFHGSLRYEEKDIEKDFSIKRFFDQFNPPGSGVGMGLEFSTDKSQYTSKQIEESNAIQEKLYPKGWSTTPNMGYVAAIKWAQMKLAGKTERSLGEFLLDTQKEIRDEYQTKIDALEGGKVEETPESIVIEETTGVTQAIRIINTAKTLSELPNQKFTDRSSVTTNLIELIASGEITSDEVKTLVEAKRDELNKSLTISDIPLQSLVTFKNGTKGYVKFKKSNNITFKMIGSKPGQTEILSLNQIKGQVFMIEEKKEVPVEKVEPIEISKEDKQEVEASKDTLKTFTDNANKVKEISNEIEKSESTENPNEDDFFDQLGCKTK